MMSFRKLSEAFKEAVYYDNEEGYGDRGEGINEMHGLVRDFKIFHEEFLRVFEWRLNTVAKILGDKTHGDDLYFIPDMDKSTTIDTEYDFKNFEVSGDLDRGTLQELMTYMLDGNKIVSQVIEDLIEEGKIPKQSALIYDAFAYRVGNIDENDGPDHYISGSFSSWHNFSTLTDALKESFGTKSSNVFDVGKNILTQVNFGNDFASTINGIFADKTELIPVEHGSLTREQVNRVINKISQWAQTYSEAELSIIAPSDAVTARKFGRILKRKNLSPGGIFNQTDKNSILRVTPPTDSQLWDTQIQIDQSDHDRIQKRGLTNTMGVNTHHSSQLLIQGTEEQVNRHHLRVTFVEDQDGIKTAFIDESQSDADQASQQDIVMELDELYPDGRDSELYDVKANSEYSYETEPDSEFGKLHGFDPDSNYKKGDVVVEGKGIFVAQSDTEPGVSPSETINSGRINPFEKWRMLGKRKSGVERGYSQDKRPSKDEILKSMNNFYLLSDYDRTTDTDQGHYFLVHIQPELLAYHDVNRPAPGLDFEQMAGLEVYDIPDLPFKGVRVLDGRNDEGKMIEFMGEEARNVSGWNPDNLTAQEVREEYLEKLRGYGGFLGTIRQTDSMPFSSIKNLLKIKFNNQVRGGQSIFKKNVELAAVKFLAREMAVRGVKRIAFTRGDIIYPIVSSADSDIKKSAVRGGLKSQGIQQAYIRTAQVVAKFFGVPLEQLSRKHEKKINNEHIRVKARGRLMELTKSQSSPFQPEFYDDDVYDSEDGTVVTTAPESGESNSYTSLNVLDARSPSTIALAKDGVVEFTQKVTAGHRGSNAIFILDPNNPVAVQKLANDNEVFLFNRRPQGSSEDVSDHYWNSLIGENALGQNASPDLEQMRTEGRSTLNDIERLEIPADRKARLMEVARQAKFHTQRQAKLLWVLTGRGRIQSPGEVGDVSLLSVLDELKSAYRMIEGGLNLRRVKFEGDKYYYLEPGETFDPEESQSLNEPRPNFTQVTGIGNKETSSLPDENGMFASTPVDTYAFDTTKIGMRNEDGSTEVLPGRELIETPQGTKGIVLPLNTTSMVEQQWADSVAKGAMSNKRVLEYGRSNILLSFLRAPGTLIGHVETFFTPVGTYAFQGEALEDFDKKFSAFNKTDVYKPGSETTEDEMDTLFRDYYKNKYGRRPPPATQDSWNNASLEEKRNVWKKLGGPESSAEATEVKETNFMPILLEYHGSYIMYALDLQTRQMLEDIQQYFDAYKALGDADADLYETMMGISEITLNAKIKGLPQPVDLLYHNPVSEDFSMINPATTVPQAPMELTDFGRTVASDKFRSEIADGSTVTFDALRHLDHLAGDRFYDTGSMRGSIYPAISASVELTDGKFVKDENPKIFEEGDTLRPKRKLHPITVTNGFPVQEVGYNTVSKYLNPSYRLDQSELDQDTHQNWEDFRLDLSGEENDKLDRVVKRMLLNHVMDMQHLVKTEEQGTQDFQYIDIPQERLNQNLTQGERYLMADEIEGARRNTRTHVTIEKQDGNFVINNGIISEGTEGVEVNESVYKVTGLPNDELLTENMMKQGLVRLKSTPSRVGVLVMNENGTPLTKEGHSLLREGGIKSWIPNEQLEAYDKTDVAQMSDQLNFIFDGRADNRGKYIVVENGSTELSKGQIIQRNEANKYTGSGALFRKYDEYLEEQEEARKQDSVEDPPDISVKQTPIENNEDLVKLITSDYIWGHDDYNQYYRIALDVHRRTGIHMNRILREIDSINHLFDLTPFDDRDKFKAIAITQGRKISPNRIKQYMQDPTVSNPNGLQGNVMPEANSVAMGQINAAALNEASIALAASAQEIRTLVDNEKMSVDEMHKKYLKGKTPTKQMKILQKNYGDSMQTQSIAQHRNNDNIRDEARKRANNMAEKQINHILYSQAAIQNSLDPTQPNSIMAKIVELEQKTILDEAHLFDRSKHGDRVRQTIDSRVATTQQELIDEIGDSATDVILKAYKVITGRTQTDQDFRDALQAVESHRKNSISADFISDLILDVSKLANIEKLDAQALYNIIRPRMNDEGKAIILSAVLNLHKDLILFAKVSQSRDLTKRRDLLAKMQDLSTSTLGELKVLVSPKSRGFFPLGGAVEQEVQMSFANDRISLLEAEIQRDKAILDNKVYDVLFKNYDEVAKRLRYLLGHNPATQVSDGTMFPVMTSLKDGGYGMTEIKVQLNNKMQYENLEELKEAVLINKEYLKNAPAEDRGSPDYNYIKQMTRNVEILPIWKIHNEQGGRFRLWSIKSARERFGEMGTRGRNLERMILQFESAVKAERPNVARLSREWNSAFDEARNNWGFTHGHLFMEQVISPIIKWNEDQPQISGDKKAFQAGAFKYAMNLVSTDQDESILKDTLFKLFDEYEKSADYHREIAQRYGLKVRDEKSPIRDMLGRPQPDMNKKRRKGNESYGDYLFRDPITRGYLTIPRVLKSSVLQMILDEMPKHGWSQDAVNTEDVMAFSWEKLATIMKSKEVSQEAKEGELEVAIIELLGDGDMVLDKFITPYIKNTSPRELFNQPDPQLKIPRSELVAAWDIANQKEGSFEKFEMWIDVLYERLNHKEDRSDYVEFKYGILKKLRNRYRQLRKSVESYGKQSLEGGITLAGHLMDSRAQDAIIPQEFLTYTAYDEVTSGALLARTMQNAFFGRNAENLKGEMQSLFKELSDKHTLLNDLASRVGAVPNPHGVPKFTKSQALRAELEAERLENIPGKTGKEKFKNLKNSVGQLKNLVGRPKLGLNGAMQHVDAYFNSDLGPFKDEAMFWELLGLNSYFVLNQPKSGLTNLMSLFDFTMKFGGAGKMSATAVINAWQNVGAEAFSGIMANLGVDSANIPLANKVLGTHMYADELMDIFFMTSENDVGARKAILDVGSGGVKNASKMQFFKHGILRPFKNILNYDSRRGLKVSNEDGTRKYAPFSLRTMLLKPFSYIGTLANHSIAVATARRVDAYVREVARHIESVNKTQIKNGMPLLPEDHQVTSDELGKKGFEKRAFDILNNDISYYGLGSISNLARDYIERRKSGDKRGLTKENVIAIGHMGVNETAMEGGFATKPGAFSSTFYGRIMAPLQSWSLKKVNQANNSVRSEETGEVEAMALARMMATLVAVSIPLGMAYSFWSDEYDEKLLGKGSPLRPAPRTTMIPFAGLFIGDPKENAKAMLERLARAGNIGGMALDFANTAYNYADPYSYNRGFSLDSRVLLMSQATNAVKAMGNFIHMGGKFDWANVGRPLAYSMGANGPLQHFNMMSHLLDIDSEERRITRQVGNRHKIRAGLNVLGIERRPMVGGGMPKTAFSAAVRTMERAAEADDSVGFNEAYAEAIEYSIERGDEDPEKAVLNGFKRRNYRQGIARYKLSDDEWSNILSLYSDKQARPLRYAMEQHEKYVDILNASTSSKTKKKFKPLNTTPASYEEIIKRSLSY